MKMYNFNLAKMIINNAKNVESAQLGMHEDWLWTAETVSNKIWKNKEVAGINGSKWGTPVLQLTFKDGSVQVFECFKLEGVEVCPLEKAMQAAQATAGVMSTGCQNWRETLNVMKPAILN